MKSTAKKTAKPRIKRSPPPKPDPAYRQLWRTIEGAVRDALQMHPEYVAKGKVPRTVVNSITKRVTGSIISLADSKAIGVSAEGPQKGKPGSGLKGQALS